MIDSLFPIFVGPRPRPSSWNVIGSMWTIDKKLVVRTIVNMYLKDNKALQRCLKIALELENCLPILLSLPPHAFVVELATAASASSVAARKNQKLNLEQWLNQRLMDASTASSFAVVVQWMQVQNLPLQILFVFMKCLNSNKNVMTRVTEEHFVRLYQVCVQRYPQMQMIGKEKGIDQLANEYFQQIYSGSQSIDQIVEMLKRFRHSSQSREKEIFACMIHNLFDEYRFFDKYPTRELGITGVLFGALIQHQLVSDVTLGVALRYVLEALQKLPNEKLFHFGKVALEQFRGRLMEWLSTVHI